MTSRERNLGVGVGAVAVVFIGYWGVGQYNEAKADLDRQIQKKKDERAEVNRDKKLALGRADLWRGYGSQTLSMDANEVQTRLRNEVNRLAEECNLKDIRLVISKSSTLGKPARNQKEFVRVLSASFDADGQVGEFVRFLFRLHGRPYHVRLKNLSLVRPSSKAEKGLVHMKATLETPILPPTKLVPRVIPNKPEVPEEQEKPRTVLAKLDGYSKAIVKRKIFLPYEDVVIKAANPNPTNGSALPQPEQPAADLRWAAGGKDVIGYKVYFSEGTPTFKDPPLEPAKSQTSIHRDGLKPGPMYYWRVDTVHENWEGEEITTKGDPWSFRVNPKPTPPPPPPPGQLVQTPVDAQFTVARILSSPIGQYVILEDRRTPNNPNPPERKVEVGQELLDGTLVYLHPRGVVSEKMEANNVPVWRFHPIGEQVQQGMKPQAEFQNKYGDIYNELVKLRDNYTGITQRPAGSPNAGG